MTRSIDNHIESSSNNMATTVTQRMGRLFSTTSVPVNLQSDDLVDDIPKKRQSFSRVRKLSKRLSSTFKSSLSLREEDINEAEGTTTFDRSFTQKKKSSKKTTLGRVLSLQVFHDNQEFREVDINIDGPEKSCHRMPASTQQQHAYSTMDLSSTNSHDGLRRVLSVPASSTLRSPSPYGKLEHYTKLEQLGEGSYATVYKGISKINNVFVALKEIRLQEEEGIPFTAIREASLLKDLKHANIVRLHDIIPAKEHLVLVFEYLNTDLCMFLEERPFGLHPFNAKLLLFQLLRGLHYIHEKQILHRDIKPQNVLLSNRGELKLADFGLARAKSVPSRTYTHEIVTLWYRPPDVLLGSTHYTTSLDIWGVGCIFIEMISGFPLFPGVKSARDQLTKIFKVCGTPDKSSWPDQINGYRRDDFNIFPKKSFSHQAPRLKAIPHAEVLADKMLQFNPRDRISAIDGMHHAYFEELPKALHTLPKTTSIFAIPGLSMAEDHRRPETTKAKTHSTKMLGHFV